MRATSQCDSPGFEYASHDRRGGSHRNQEGSIVCIYTNCGVDYIKSYKGYLSYRRDGGERIHTKTQFLSRISPDVY